MCNEFKSCENLQNSIHKQIQRLHMSQCTSEQILYGIKLHVSQKFT